MQRTSAIVIMVVVGASALGCAGRERRPDGPYREAQELADALSDELVACVREHKLPATGQVVIAAALTPAGAPPSIHDAGSSSGSDAVVACVQQRSTQKLHNPSASPGPFVRIRAPLPLVTSEVSYGFVNELPGQESPR